MRYGVDLDGIVVDMHRGLVEVINSIWPDRLSRDAVPTDWDLTSLGLKQGELGVVWNKIATLRNWWMSLPAYPRNVHAVARHRMMHPEDEIFYVTARTVETTGLPIMHQSQRWLEMCGISGLGTAVIVVPEGEKKIDVYERIGVEYAIDDAPHVVKEGSHVIYMLSRPWNLGDQKGLDVVKSLDEFFTTTHK